MKQNLISIESLAEIMFNVFDKVECDMTHYEAMWSGLISAMNFRYKEANDLRSDIWIDCENDFKGEPDQMFLSEVNRKDITLEKFTRIVREFIEPMQVENILPESLLNKMF